MIIVGCAALFLLVLVIESEMRSRSRRIKRAAVMETLVSVLDEDPDEVRELFDLIEGKS